MKYIDIDIDIDADIDIDITNVYCMDAGDFYIVGTTKGDLYVIRQETG